MYPISLNSSAWFLICFILFLVIFYRPVKFFIFKFLDSKIDAISSRLINSENIKIQAEKSMIQSEKDLLELRNKSAAFRASALAEIDKFLEQEQLLFKQDIARKRNILKTDIGEMKRLALADIQEDFLNKTQILVSEFLKTNKEKIYYIK